MMANATLPRINADRALRDWQAESRLETREEQMDRRYVLKFGAVTALGAARNRPCGLPAFAQQKLVLKATDVHPLGYPTVEAVVRMGKKLETATNGRAQRPDVSRRCSSAARRR